MNRRSRIPIILLLYLRGKPLFSFRSAENETSIGPAEPERIRKNVFDFAFARLVRHEVDTRLHRRIIEVQRGRDDLIPQGEDGENRFDRTRRAKQMPNRGLCRRHG